MIYFLIFFIFIAIILFFIKNKIHVKVSTFFKKGFKKIDNKFRCPLLLSESRGHGKTYSAVDFCKKLISQGYFLITNIKSFSDYLGVNDSLYLCNIMDIIYLLESSNTYNGRPVIILFDEIFSVIEKSKLPKPILSFLSQMRKRGLIFITTCQEWLELNITLRRYVRFQVNCNMWSLPFIHTAFIYNQVNDASNMKWDNNENEYVCPVIQTNLSKGLKSVIDSYDTYETIQTI